MATGIVNDVEKILACADIVRVIGEYVDLEPAGENYRGLCPFHKEKTPSFNVNPRKRVFHCFGCHVGGDVIEFVRRLENTSFIVALRRVRDKVWKWPE
jgi:DNA primase